MRQKLKELHFYHHADFRRGGILQFLESTVWIDALIEKNTIKYGTFILPFEEAFPVFKTCFKIPIMFFFAGNTNIGNVYYLITLNCVLQSVTSA